jgi:hypothetical protein
VTAPAGAAGEIQWHPDTLTARGEQPEELPAGSQVFTLNRLRDLVPA